MGLWLYALLKARHLVHVLMASVGIGRVGAQTQKVQGIAAMSCCHQQVCQEKTGTQAQDTIAMPCSFCGPVFSVLL